MLNNLLCDFFEARAEVGSVVGFDDDLLRSILLLDPASVVEKRIFLADNGLQELGGVFAFGKSLDPAKQAAFEPVFVVGAYFALDLGRRGFWRPVAPGGVDRTHVGAQLRHRVKVAHPEFFRLGCAFRFFNAFWLAR